MRVLAFLVRPGALGSQRIKISGTSIHEMKRDRDGKSAKRSAIRYSAVVVNDHMYPRPYIFFFTQKGS